MPARRKSATELELSGAAKAKPKRYADRLNKPELPRLGYPPRCLSDEEKDVWRQIVKQAPAGLLCAADEFIIEVAVRLLVRIRASAAPKASEVTTLLTVLGKLGMNPLDRERLVLPATPKPAEDDPWAGF